MKNKDKKRFIEAMAKLEIVFPQHANLKEEKINLYFDVLADLSIEQVETNVYDLIKVRKYPTFPTVGEIREPRVLTAQEIEDEELAALKRRDGH